MGGRKQDRQTQKLFDNVTKSLLTQKELQEEAQYKANNSYPDDLPLKEEYPVAKTYIAATAPFKAIGTGLAKGLGGIGEKMMPSAFLKGIGQTFPKLAKATTAISPYADAGLLATGGAQGIQEAKEAAKSGDAAGAIAGASMAALPLMGINPEVAQELTATQKANKVARALNKDVKNTEIVDSPVTQNILAGKLGGAPRQNKVIWHNSETPISKLESTFPAGDIVKRDAPLGHVWGTGTETTQGFIGARPFHLRSTKPVEMNKPMVQLNESIGNGKNAVRNEILKYADQSGADAVNFSNIKDNTLSNQDVYAVFKDIEVKPKLSEAEKLGIPKVERSNPKALEDPQYGGYQQGNDKYNAAVESGNVDEARRIKKLHTDINAKRFDGSSIFTGYHFTTNPELLSFNGINKGYIKRQNPIYLTSSEIGKSIYNPGDAFPSQIRKKFYIKMRNPLSEIKSERDYGGDLDKTLSTNPTAREEIRKFGRNKYDSLDDAAIEAHEAGNKDLSKELSKEMFRIGDNNIHGTYSKQFKMKQSEIFDLSRDPNFENLLKQEFNSDGIIHNVSGTKHYITYNPKSIKSANVITYDDFGNMIPIVKRDNFRNPDLRYKQGGILKAQKGKSLMK